MFACCVETPQRCVNAGQTIAHGFALGFGAQLKALFAQGDVDEPRVHGG